MVSAREDNVQNKPIDDLIDILIYTVNDTRDFVSVFVCVCVCVRVKGKAVPVQV